MSAEREQMLQSIRSSLSRTRATLMALAGDAVAPLAPGPGSAAEMIERFASEWTRLSGTCSRCPDEAAATAALVDLLRARSVTRLLGWRPEQIGLAGLEDALRAAGIELHDAVARGRPDERVAAVRAFEAYPASVSGVDVAVATTGTLMLRSGHGRGRLASLLAPLHIAVVRASDVVWTLEAAYEHQRRRHGDELFAEASNLIFISGPSRTGDIEMVLTVGVHGPGEVHCIIVED